MDFSTDSDEWTDSSDDGRLDDLKPHRSLDHLDPSVKEQLLKSEYYRPLKEQNKTKKNIDLPKREIQSNLKYSDSEKVHGQSQTILTGNLQLRKCFTGLNVVHDTVCGNGNKSNHAACQTSSTGDVCSLKDEVVQSKLLHKPEDLGCQWENLMNIPFVQSNLVGLINSNRNDDIKLYGNKRSPEQENDFEPRHVACQTASSGSIKAIDFYTGNSLVDKDGGNESMNHILCQTRITGDIPCSSSVELKNVGSNKFVFDNLLPLQANPPVCICSVCIQETLHYENGVPWGICKLWDYRFSTKKTRATEYDNEEHVWYINNCLTYSQSQEIVSLVPNMMIKDELSTVRKKKKKTEDLAKVNVTSEPSTGRVIDDDQTKRTLSFLHHYTDSLVDRNYKLPDVHNNFDQQAVRKGGVKANTECQTNISGNLRYDHFYCGRCVVSDPVCILDSDGEEYVFNTKRNAQSQTNSTGDIWSLFKQCDQLEVITRNFTESPTHKRTVMKENIHLVPEIAENESTHCGEGLMLGVGVLRQRTNILSLLRKQQDRNQLVSCDVDDQDIAIEVVDSSPTQDSETHKINNRDCNTLSIEFPNQNISLVPKVKSGRPTVGMQTMMTQNDFDQYNEILFMLDIVESSVVWKHGSLKRALLGPLKQSTKETQTELGDFPCNFAFDSCFCELLPYTKITDTIPKVMETNYKLFDQTCSCCNVAALVTNHDNETEKSPSYLRDLMIKRFVPACHSVHVQTEPGNFSCDELAHYGKETEGTVQNFLLGMDLELFLYFLYLK